MNILSIPVISSGYKRPTCFKSISAIKKVAMIDFDYLNTDIPYYYNDAGQIEIIDTTNQPYFVFDVVPQTTDFNEKFSFDKKTGLFYFDGKFEILFHKLRTQLRTQLLQFIFSPRLSILLQDAATDKWWIIGKEFGATLDDGSMNSFGKKRLDFQGQKLFFKTNEMYPIQEVLNTAFSLSAVQSSSTN